MNQTRIYQITLISLFYFASFQITLQLKFPNIVKQTNLLSPAEKINKTNTRFSEYHFLINNMCSLI